jgi:ribosomal 50S subunit-recycling heat shock protein
LPFYNKNFYFLGLFMRVDKFLKVSRILKRRTLAQDAANGGRIKINGKTVKPSHQIKVGDILEIGFNSGTVKVRINDVKETVKKEQAESLYEVLED